MTNGDDRSVSASGNITGSIVQTGDRNQAEFTAVQLPSAASVDIAAAMAGLRAELLALDSPEKGRIERALAEAEMEARSEQPDRGEVAGRIERALGLAKKAGDFGEHLGKIQDLVTRIGGWIGAASPYAGPLLASVGLGIAL